MTVNRYQKYNLLKYFLAFFKNLKFRNKLFISYIVIIIIPLVVLGLYSYWQAKSFLLSEAKQGLKESVSQIVVNLNSNFKRYDNAINFIIYNPQIVQIVDNEDANYFQKYVNYTEVLDPLFGTIINLNNEMDSLVIYTSNDKITERTNSIQSLSRIQSSPWFKNIMLDRKTHWVMENGTLIGINRFYEPFKNAPLNILYTKMKYNNVFNIEIKNAKEFNICIYDKEKNIIFSKSNNEKAKPSVLENEVIGLPGGEVKINGVSCMLIKEQIAETGWTLAYFSPVSTIAINANNIVGAMVIIILVCFIILIFVTWVFSKTFVKRIYKLISKMKLVEEGNLKLDVYSNSKDEIGELTNRFGKMLKNVNAMIDEVYHSKIIQKEAEMKALQAQINPHFLYNTLSLINWKALKIDALEISQITRNISKFYRTVLNKGKNIISVKDEIENTKYYLEIQLSMHNNSFDVDYHIEDEIFKYDMIKTILQPIVENAIEHGIDQLEIERGKLIISGFIKEESIFLVVEDNGPGMDEKIQAHIFTQNSNGYGMKNVQERLKIFFGEESGISLSSQNGKGTQVMVKIPKFLEADAVRP